MGLTSDRDDEERLTLLRIAERRDRGIVRTDQS